MDSTVGAGGVLQLNGVRTKWGKTTRKGNSKTNHDFSLLISYDTVLALEFDQTPRFVWKIWFSLLARLRWKRLSRRSQNVAIELTQPNWRIFTTVGQRSAIPRGCRIKMQNLFGRWILLNLKRVFPGSFLLALSLTNNEVTTRKWSESVCASGNVSTFWTLFFHRDGARL